MVSTRSRPGAYGYEYGVDIVRMSEVEAAWLAGLLEGEGCFQYQPERYRADGRRYARACIQIQLHMNDKDVVDRAAKLMDSKVRPRRKPEQKHHKQTWSTTVAGQKAEDVMKLILPYMGERRIGRINECLSDPDLSHR